MTGLSRRTFFKLAAGAAAVVAMPGAAAKLLAEPVVPAVQSLSGGWLVCNGARIPRDEYKELFSVIGKLYGGDGSEFAIPDYGEVGRIKYLIKTRVDDDTMPIGSIVAASLSGV